MTLSARILAALADSAVPVRTSILIGRVKGKRSSVWRSLAFLVRSGRVRRELRADLIERCRCPTCGRLSRARRARREAFWTLSACREAA